MYPHASEIDTLLSITIKLLAPICYDNMWCFAPILVLKVSSMTLLYSCNFHIIGVAQQSLNSPGGAGRRRQREMSEVRKCSETFHFRASGQTGGQGHSGHRERAPPCPKVALLLPFWCKPRRGKSIVLSSEEILMRAPRGTDESCIVLLRLHTHCRNKDNCLKRTCWGIQNKGIPCFIMRFHTLSAIIPHMIMNSFSPWESWTHHTGCRGSVKAGSQFCFCLIVNYLPITKPQGNWCRWESGNLHED